MAKKPQSLSDNILFHAAKVPLFLQDGTATSVLGVQRDDTKAIIGTVSDNYGIIQNSEAIAIIEDGFTKQGMHTFTRTAYALQGGSQMVATYDFGLDTVLVPRLNDILGLRFILRNSFDGSTPLGFDIGFLRLVCLNGMKAMVKGFSLTKKHYTGISLEFVREQLAKALLRARDAVNVYGDMALVSINQVQGENILANLAASGVFSARIGEGIKAIWQNPTHAADRERNLYNLLNASTQYVTHTVQPERFEMAQKLQGNIATAFARLLSVTVRDEMSLAPVIDI